LLRVIADETFSTTRNITYIGYFNFINNLAYKENPLDTEVDYSRSNQTLFKTLDFMRFCCLKHANQHL